MTPEQFCYWLNGFAELNGCDITPEQWRSIKEHLQTVFYKVTPSAPGTVPIPYPLQEWGPIPTIIC